MGSTRLRVRFLAVLCGGLLLGSVPLACSGSTSKEDLKPTCSAGSPGTQCFAPGSTHFNEGLTPTPQPTPTPHFDANNCQVREEVRDGCCNAAVTGPELIDGQCCYGFCTGACCGRPLLVDGEPRVAPSAARGDWADFLAVDVGKLSASERQELARQWLGDAQLEHASIASFARFVLDLLAFGAPPELVAGAQRAMADELAHARACFGLASTYAGAPLGPAPLDLTGVAPSSSLAESAAAAVREGCINETIAALTAEEQATRAADPCVRQVLERIARDEADHAELAWRFVVWALQTGDAVVAHAVHTELHRPPAPDLTPVAREAWRDVIAPCAAALS